MNAKPFVAFCVIVHDFEHLRTMGTINPLGGARVRLHL